MRDKYHVISSSTPVDSSTSSSNPSFQQELFDELCLQWMTAVGEETLIDEDFTKEKLQKACEIVCTQFPRGNKPGQLLEHPIVDETPLESRGVSMRWLLAALKWMRKATGQQSPVLPSRLFVSLFIEPLVAHQRRTSMTTHTDELHGQDIHALPLYFFVPPEDRGNPQVFLSHGWDSWLRQLLFFPKATVPAKLALSLGRDKTFLWLDLFAIVQDPGSSLQKSQVAKIGEVVRHIGNTCLIIPGHGSPNNFALLPAQRSWCCFEIAFTPVSNLSARVGWHSTHFGKETPETLSKATSFHQIVATCIEALDCAQAQTSSQDERQAINILLEDEIGVEVANRIVRRAIFQAFIDRYTNDGSFRAKKSRDDQVSTLYSEAMESCETRGLI